MSKVKSASLYQLIKSLKKSEKRYFRLSVDRGGNGEEKKYLRLFDSIDAQQQFDEENIATCPETGERYQLREGSLTFID